MRCLSLLQPWASLVVIGAKRYETRSWATSYRGPLLIHASKRFRREDIERSLQEPFRSALTNYLAVSNGMTLSDLPLGAIIGKVDLVGCYATVGKSVRVGEPGHWRAENLDACELAFGDFSFGRYAWKMEKPVRFPNPIPWMGQLGLYKVPELALAECGVKA